MSGKKKRIIKVKKGESFAAYLERKGACGLANVIRQHVSTPKLITPDPVLHWT